MPGIITSRRITSGSCAEISSNASSPELAPTTVNPRGESTASMRRTFCGRSSTTSTVPPSSVMTTSRPTCEQVAPHLVRELAHTDRLLEVAVEAGRQRLLAIRAHGEGGEGDDGDGGRSWVLPQPSERRVPTDPGELEVHQDEVREAPGCFGDRVLPCRGDRHREPGELQDVSRELEVSRVVLDEQHPALAHPVASVVVPGPAPVVARAVATWASLRASPPRS